MARTYKALILAVTVLMLFIALIFIPYIKKFNFENFLEDISSNEILDNAILSVSAKYENEDEYLIQYNSTEKIHPGSNFKLFTAAYALEQLGSDFSFSTKLFLTKDNDLVLVGGGDPTLDVQDLNGFIQALKNLKWKAGKLFYDDNYFHGEQYGPNWDSMWFEEYFAVPVSGLQINDNLIEIFGINDEKTDEFEITTLPLKNHRGIIDEREIKTKIKEITNPTTAVWNTEDEIITLKGETTVNLPFSLSATVKNPGLYTAKIFAQELEAEGFTINEIGSINAENYGVLVYEHNSKPLRELIPRMLKLSLNHYAESLIRVLGENSEMDDIEDSQAKGVASLTEFTKSLKIPSAQFQAFDGSGLSSSTRVSSESIIVLFDYIDHQNWRKYFWDSLSEAGKNGTLKSRFKSFDEGTILMGKTGTHVKANSLSGKIIRKNQKNILFSIHVYNHNFSTKESIINIVPIIDRIVILLEKQF